VHGGPALVLDANFPTDGRGSFQLALPLPSTPVISVLCSGSALMSKPTQSTSGST